MAFIAINISLHSRRIKGRGWGKRKRIRGKKRRRVILTAFSSSPPSLYTLAMQAINIYTTVRASTMKF